MPNNLDTHTPKVKLNTQVLKGTIILKVLIENKVRKLKRNTVWNKLVLMVVGGGVTFFPRQPGVDKDVICGQSL